MDVSSHLHPRGASIWVHPRRISIICCSCSFPMEHRCLHSYVWLTSQTNYSLLIPTQRVDLIQGQDGISGSLKSRFMDKDTLLPGSALCAFCNKNERQKYVSASNENFLQLFIKLQLLTCNRVTKNTQLMLTSDMQQKWTQLRTQEPLSHSSLSIYPFTHLLSCFTRFRILWTAILSGRKRRRKWEEFTYSNLETDSI